LPEDDLCLRAARALQQASATGLGADINIDKQIPWGAGLGGGSSDAATTLLALNRLWNLNWPRQRLAELALKLGADLPFFIGGRNAWVEGIGEQLTPIDEALDFGRTRWAVLKPALAIPTKDVFSSPLLSQLLLANAGNAAIVADFLAAVKINDDCGRSDLGLDFGRNDLQDAALNYAKYNSASIDAKRSSNDAGLGSKDDLSLALNLLRDRYGSSRMSGSGSAVFAYAGANKGACLPMFTPEELPEGWCGRLCAGLSSHPLFEWANS
jgi:4-diphosphocytidyl-2-C-methyl-D-erythritol kinase